MKPYNSEDGIFLIKNNKKYKCIYITLHCHVCSSKNKEMKKEMKSNNKERRKKKMGKINKTSLN